MKKSIFTIAVFLTGLFAGAQDFKILKEENKEWGITNYKLDCSKNSPLLANKLNYNLNKVVFDSKEKQDVYHVTLLVKGAYKNPLNKDLTISTILEDGTVITNKETLEDGGNFNGKCTLHLVRFDQMRKIGIKEIKINGVSEKSFKVNKKNRKDLMKNMNSIVDAE
jgi:hypothetical protein